MARIVIIGPGDGLLSRYGHVALWIEDRGEGTDVVYNYGISQTPSTRQNILRHLLRNDVLVRSETRDFNDMIAQYAATDRDIRILTLNLTKYQVSTLHNELEMDLRYREPQLQDFYLNNCTTGIRDVLDRVLQGEIRAATEAVPTAHSFRFHSLRYVGSDPHLYLGLLVALSGSVDRPMSQWEAMFLPELLEANLLEVMVTNEDGNRVPLIASSSQIYSDGRAPVPPRPPTTWPILLAIGIVLGLGMAVTGRRSREGALWRIGFTAIAGPWLMGVGTVGIVLLLAWSTGNQYLIAQNENMLQWNPLAFVMGFMVVTGSLRMDDSVRIMRWLASGLVIAAVLGSVMKVLPWFTQANGAIIALSLPAHVGFAWGVWHWQGRVATADAGHYGPEET